MDIKITLAALTALSLAGCGSIPISTQAQVGDIEPMMRAIRSGMIQPNEYLTQKHVQEKRLPICSIRGINTQEQAAIEELLARGARLDMPCESPDIGEFPLDYLATMAFTWSVSESLLYEPELEDYYQLQAERYLKAGAKSSLYHIRSIDDFLEKKEEAQQQKREGKILLAQMEAEKATEKAEQEKRDKESNQNTLMGLATIAAMATINYQATKSASRQASTSLPIADVQKLGQQNTEPASPSDKGTSITPGTSQPVVGAENVKLGKPELYTSSSSLNSANTQHSDAKSTAPSIAQTSTPPATPPTDQRTYPNLPAVHNAVWSDYQLNSTTVKIWCEKSTQQIRDSFEQSKNELISIGSCTCKNISKTTILQPEYACEFPYVWKQNVPSDSR